MTDQLGRTIDYLRISVTDRCNLRCRYCMPQEGIGLMNHEDILSYQEISRIVRAGISLGINKVKITGGEPLVRKDIEELVREIAGMSGVTDVTMTSNGLLLAGLAKVLKQAGLTSVNVSLDTLDPDVYRGITRRGCLEDAMEGIRAAVGEGLLVKVNCAVLEALTKEDVAAFAEFSIESHVPVRFIEMMPIGEGRAFKSLDNAVIDGILKELYPDYHPVDGPSGHGPARYFTFGGGKGCAGFISPVHHQFCGSCNRVRLTSDGFLKLCLDSADGTDLRTPLRSGITDEELRRIMEQSIYRKPAGHHFSEAREAAGPHMNQIGG